eukprot:TRINITY_DN32_c0_g1_i1.p1 TRINITY_DN32_c0_g1~~TRINITY_DN32_c0_g1_i1.p1  ORF type:complete len:191 (+),score=15.76 TRINITY_DN32_c0_g1_i1:489-1061(+)
MLSPRSACCASDRRAMISAIVMSILCCIFIIASMAFLFQAIGSGIATYSDEIEAICTVFNATSVQNSELRYYVDLQVSVSNETGYFNHTRWGGATIFLSSATYDTADAALSAAAAQYPIGYSGKCHGRPEAPGVWSWGTSSRSEFPGLMNAFIAFGAFAIAFLIASIVSCVFCCRKLSSSAEMSAYDHVT